MRELTTSARNLVRSKRARAFTIDMLRQVAELGLLAARSWAKGRRNPGRYGRAGSTAPRRRPSAPPGPGRALFESALVSEMLRMGHHPTGKELDASWEQGNDPWGFPAFNPSPDGRFSVRYHFLDGERTGGLYAGNIELEPSGYQPPLTRNNFGGPAVWSPDSCYLAIPRWLILMPAQELLIFDLEQMRQAAVPKLTQVLQIQSFDGTYVRGIQNVGFNPEPFFARIDRLKWTPLKVRAGGAG